MNPQKRPAFQLDGIQTANQGGVKQYDSKKDKYLKDFNSNLLKKQKEKGTSRFQTESNRHPNNSSIISLNQSIQFHQRPSIKSNHLNRLYTQNQYPDKSMSPNIQTRLQNIPKNKREGGVSLPKLDSTNSNLQKPVTRSQLLQFLDQIMFAVENVQQIVSQYDNPPREIYQSQPVRQMAKFKIKQEQQTEHSYIQSQIKNKQSYINKANKNTQTPNKQIRANSEICDQQKINKKTTKIKTEFTEESDGTEKRHTRFPNIIQKSQKQKIKKILPENRKNRVQSQVISFSYVNQKENDQIQKENTNKQISSNETQQNSEQSNIIYESSQQNQIKINIDLKNQRQSTPSSSTNLVETQKKQQKSINNSANQLKKTNSNAMIIQIQNKQDQNQSIQQISSNRYSLSDFEDVDQDVLISKSSQQDQQISQKKQDNEKQTPKVNKRSIQIKNQIETNDQDEHHKQLDQKTIELRQNTNEQQCKAQQFQSHLNNEDQEFSNEFLSEQTKPQTKNSSNTKKQQINNLTQKQNSSKKILQINPDPDFYPDDAQQQDKQYDKQNEQYEDSHQNDQIDDKMNQLNEQLNKIDTNFETTEQKLTYQNQQKNPEVQNQSQLIQIQNDQQKSQIPDQKSQKSIKNLEQVESLENKQQFISSDISQGVPQNKEEIQNSKDFRPQSVKQNQDEYSELNSIVNSIYVQPNDFAYQKNNHQTDIQLDKNEEIQTQSQQLNNNQQITQFDNSRKDQIMDKLQNQKLILKNNEDLGESLLINEAQSKNSVNKQERQDIEKKTHLKANFAQSHQVKSDQTGFKFQPKNFQQSGAYSIIFDKTKYKNYNQGKTKIINDCDDEQKSKEQIIDQTEKQWYNVKTHKSLQIIESKQNDENKKTNTKSQILHDKEELDEEFIKMLNKTKKIDQNNQKSDEVKNENVISDKLRRQNSTKKLQQSQVIVNETQGSNNQNQPKEKDNSVLDEDPQNIELNDSQLQKKEQVILVQGNVIENSKMQDESIKQANIQEQNSSQVQPQKIEKLDNKDPEVIDQN
ncbi:unnamed protein product [Paramecium sonneborni]|uniref:Uncharacterized protein n=1 Tax=Paramecium sonneborni TaxID=65129 RepID=A0A8S1MZ71_9CILI|nr:unnamed protein product [Paramecium sonneborni]